jgi:3-methyladenine DNA glycosylase/8-oxoguanine DNA glycosylase
MSQRNPPATVIELPYKPGFDWTSMLSFIAPRVIPGVESILDSHYQRTFRLDNNHRGWFKVTDCPQQGFLHLSIFPEEGNHPSTQIEQRVRSIFDLDTDMAPILRALKKDPLLSPAIEAYPGLRLPGTWDPFEFTVRAILGQQISVKAATTLAGRVASLCGPGCKTGYPEELKSFFPTAEEVCHSDLSDIGITSKRQATIKGLARNVVEQKVSLAAEQGLENFVDSLTSLPGIGPWTAHYVAMRALKFADAFPDSDLGVKKALMQNGKRPTPTQVVKRADAWRPWRAYATLLLWKLSALSTEKSQG